MFVLQAQSAITNFFALFMKLDCAPWIDWGILFNMEKNIEVIGGGIKCDNPKCDFLDKDVAVADYPGWVNKPCPKCGENLLTEEDYNNTKLLLGMADLINGLTPEELKEFNDAMGFTVEDIKNSPAFKDAVGLEFLDTDQPSIVSFETHKKIKATEIKKV
jgi:hypothetical protein